MHCASAQRLRTRPCIQAMEEEEEEIKCLGCGSTSTATKSWYGRAAFLVEVVYDNLSEGTILAGCFRAADCVPRGDRAHAR